jgi:hypothetical protein
MNEHPQPFAFPAITDEAVITINEFLDRRCGERTCEA